MSLYLEKQCCTFEKVLKFYSKFKSFERPGTDLFEDATWTTKCNAMYKCTM